MTEKQILNSKKATIFGFFTYMLFSAINYFSYLLMDENVISSPIIFWSGLLVSFGYNAFLNLKDNKNNGYKRPGS
ncbi:hypothetical protein [Sporosarcina aquimarina]|nr:hypothetical protein [Sporosarcina aquimarina]